MNLIFAILAALLVYVVFAYNGMIKLRNRVKEAWADIDVQLKRRYNLIPNIVETVKGYASHEEGVLTQVTEARANAINATNVKDQGKAENMLAGALKSVFAVAENYPDLKANQNFLQLQGELVDTEDKIQSARRFYNSVTRDFNTKIQQIPAKFIANAFKFMAEEFFEIEEEKQRDNVEVSFNKEGTRQADAPVEAAPEAVVEAAPEPEASPAPEAPVEEESPSTIIEEKPAEEPAKCPKCGGEMTEGHVCPVTEPAAEAAPSEPEAPAEEPKAEEAPAVEPVAEETKEEPVVPAEPATEEPKAEEPVATEPEAPAEEEKSAEPETPVETAPTPEPETTAEPVVDEALKTEEAPAEPHEDQTAMPLEGESPAETPATTEGEGETKA